MSVSKRMFEDPANQYTADNDDPEAFDKSHAGTPGAHHEQRCCGNLAPYWDSYRVDGNGPTAEQRAYKISDPFGLAGGNLRPLTAKDPLRKEELLVEGPNSEYRPDFIQPDEWMRWQGLVWVEASSGPSNLPIPPHWSLDTSITKKMRWGSYGGWEFLWCAKCETGLEKSWSDTLTALPLVCRGIAMAVSYVPVYGTAVSFIISAATTLAQGGPIDQALLDGMGGALPGQPTTGIAFNAGVAIARGERIDKVAIDALPYLDKSVKDALAVADDIIYGIANGDNVPNLVLDKIQERLPPDVARGMEYARRIINGENVPEMILNDAEEAVVHAVQQEAQARIDNAPKSEKQKAFEEAQSIKNRYVAETGYQLALEKLSTEQRDSIQTGLVAGHFAKSREFIGTFETAKESDVAVHDSLEVQGSAIVHGTNGKAPALYKYKPVSDILKGQTFTINVQGYDALSGTPRREDHTDAVTDAWTRGFLIAMAVCEGSSADGPGQNAIYQTLAEEGGRRGFQAGQQVQFWRTTLGGAIAPVISLAVNNGPSLAVPTAIARHVDFVDSSPVFSLSQSGTPLPVGSKTDQRAAWVAYYARLANPSAVTMTG